MQRNDETMIAIPRYQNVQLNDLSYNNKHTLWTLFKERNYTKNDNKCNSKSVSFYSVVLHSSEKVM